MNPASESRHLPPFLAIAASLVFVCGGLLLLTSTMPWSARPESGSDTKAAADADAPAEAPVSATIAFAPPSDVGLPPASDETAAADRNGATEAAAAQPPVPQQAAPEPASTLQSDPSQVSDDDIAAASDDDAVEAEAVDAVQANAANVAQIDETEAGAAVATTAESMSVSEAEPLTQEAVEPSAALDTARADPELAEGPAEAAPAAEDQTGALLAETQGPAEAAPAAKDQTGALLAETPPAAIAAETIAEDDSEAAPPSIAAVAARAEKAEASGPAQATSESVGGGSSREARAEVAAAVPPPPLPKRKPVIAPAVPAQTARNAEQPERASRPEAGKIVAQQAPAQPGAGPSRWLPMALAPADKPIATAPQRLSGAAYSSKVWSALARSKPRAGQSGSATVSFTIGWGGSLSGVRIARSSGNARIDQLALATVRSAAFPAPASGPASFTIRIDFH